MSRCKASSSRAFFLWAAIAAGAAPGGCAASGEWDHPDAASEGLERAARWRSDGFAAMAARQYEEAALLAGEQGELPLEVNALFDAGECWLLDGRASVAAVAIDKAARKVPRMPSGGSRRRAAEFRLECLRGDLAALEGDPARALRHYEAAQARALGGERDLATMRLALLAERRGDAKRARSLAGELADPRDPRLAELRKMLQRAPSSSAATARARAAAPAQTKKAASAAVPAPPVLPRNAWGARRSRSNLDRMSAISRITVHHTATRLSGSSPRTAADAIRTFQRQHQDEKGWADIGYHFVIDPSGRIWEGRPLSWQGAHAGSPELNVGNVGVALIGDFTTQQPSAAQKQALCELLDSLCSRYRLPPSRVYTHQEIRPGPTDCPGPALQRVVAAWRRSGTLSL